MGVAGSSSMRVGLRSGFQRIRTLSRSVPFKRSLYTPSQPQKNVVLGGAVACLALLTSTELLHSFAHAEEASRILVPKDITPNDGLSKPKGERIRVKKKKKKKKRIARITNPGKFAEEAAVHKAPLCECRPFMGSQFHLEFPLVEEQEKLFKVNINMQAEKGGPQNIEKQTAGLSTELMLGKDSAFSGKLSKGSIEGRLNHCFNKNFSISSSFLNTNVFSQLSLEKHMKGKDFTLSLGYEMHHRDQTEQQVSVSYLQSIAPKYSAGCKCVHALNQLTDVQFLGQYKNLKGKNYEKEGNIVTMTVAPNFENSRANMSVGYTKMLKPGLLIVSELSVAQRPGADTAAKSYRSQCVAGVKYQSNTFIYHCAFESSGTVSANLLQVFAIGPQLILSGTMNHMTNQSTFGVGLNWAPNRQ